MKVTDKRMFTGDGELREEYRFLEQQHDPAAEQAPAVADRDDAADPGQVPASEPEPAATGTPPPGAEAAGGSSPPLGGARYAAESPDPGAAEPPSREVKAPGHGAAQERGRGARSRGQGARFPGPGAESPGRGFRSHGPQAPGYGSPDLGFLDLVSMIAEPIRFLLGDAQLPDGQSAEDLPRARLHIDLLGVLRETTLGNVSDQETAALDGLLARLRMRFVEKSGD